MKTLNFPILALTLCCGMAFGSGSYLASWAFFMAAIGFGWAEYYRKEALKCAN